MVPPSPDVGTLLALGTALCWTCSALAFESASRRVGSMPVNLLRLILAMGMLVIYGWVVRGRPLPTDATAHQWTWLLASGFVGFFIADLCMFRAFVEIGSRLASLVMCLAPLVAAGAEWAALGRSMSAAGAIGMAMTLAGIAWVVTERGEQLRRPTARGLALAAVGAFGQGLGVVMTKIAMTPQPFDDFAATQVRAIAGLGGFLALMGLTGQLPRAARALGDRPGMTALTIGAVAGPFLGVSLLNMAVVRTSAGIAQTLASLTPVLIIPFAVLVRRERVSWRAVGGAVLAFAGVAVLFLRH